MALYPAAEHKLIAPGPKDPPITPRVAILHVDAGNADSLYEYFNGKSGGVESHFHVKKSGVVEQYRDTGYQADANMRANDFAVSIETQGYGAGEWTAEQITSIKALLLWLNRTHGIPLVVCPKWDGAGIGYHILFMTEWAGEPRACPGPDRIKQFHNILVPWFTTVDPAEEDDMTPEQAKTLENIQTRVNYLIDVESGRYQVATGRHGDIVRRLNLVQAAVGALDADTDPADIARRVLAGMSPDVAKAVVAQMAAVLAQGSQTP